MIITISDIAFPDGWIVEYFDWEGRTVLTEKTKPHTGLRAVVEQAERSIHDAYDFGDAYRSVRISVEPPYDSEFSPITLVGDFWVDADGNTVEFE